jgi:hypothetical protein
MAGCDITYQMENAIPESPRSWDMRFSPTCKNSFVSSTILNGGWFAVSGQKLHQQWELTLIGVQYFDLKNIYLSFAGCIISKAC